MDVPKMAPVLGVESPRSELIGNFVSVTHELGLAAEQRRWRRRK